MNYQLFQHTMKNHKTSFIPFTSYSFVWANPILHTNRV